VSPLGRETARPLLCRRASQRLPWQLDRTGNAIMPRPGVGLLRKQREPELFLHGPSQEAAHAMLLPAGRRLQLFYRRTFRAVEQVQADLLLRLSLDRRFAPSPSANGLLPARLPFRRLHSSAFLIRLWSAPALGALDRVCTSRRVNRMRFGHWVVLQLGTAPNARHSHHPKPRHWGEALWPLALYLLGHQLRQAWMLSSREKSSSLCGRASFCDAQRLKPILQNGKPNTQPFGRKRLWKSSSGMRDQSLVGLREIHPAPSPAGQLLSLTWRNFCSWASAPVRQRRLP